MGVAVKGVYEGRRVLVCVSAGIAVYKACEVVRALQKAGCLVRVVASERSLDFVGAATWEGLVHETPVTTLTGWPHSTIPHVTLAGWADVVVVVPATADILAKMATGIADDALSTTLLAVPRETPVLVAPAMNVHMWRALATQDNVACLASRGVTVLSPTSGRLACGDVGEGKLMEVAEIARAVLDAVQPPLRDLEGVSVLVTAGPTHEAIDPVRYIANASSGKMGYAIAAEAARRGAAVTLVSGPVALEVPAGVTRVDVVSAADMHAAALAAFREVDVAICAAAVADYTPAAPADHKLKKATEHLTTIELVETADILADLCRGKHDGQRSRVVVGFAAETNDLMANARAKLERKGCDLIVANDVSRADSGFGSDTNRVSFISRAGVEEQPTLGKDEVAVRLLDRVVELVRDVRA